MNAKKTMNRACFLIAVVLAIPIFIPLRAFSADGIWTNVSGGTWSTPSNWFSDLVADNTNAVADFSTLNITTNPLINNDAARTLGTLRFGDTTPSHDWTVTNAALTLAVYSGTPIIDIINRTLVLNSVLRGTQGFVKNGIGTLRLAARNTVSGDITINQGMLEAVYGGLRDTSGRVSVSAGATLAVRSGWGASDGRYEMTNAITLSGTGKDATYGALHGYENFTCMGPITLLTDSKITQDWNNFFVNGAINGTNKNLTLGAANAPSQPGLSINGSMTLGRGALTLIGNGYIALNASNDFSGGTSVAIAAPGSLKLGHLAALGSGGLTINTGIVDLNAKNISLAWLSGTNGIITDTSTAGTTTLTLNQTSNTVYAGIISNSAVRTVILKKYGTGTLTLASTNGLFTSAVAVEEGKVMMVAGGTQRGAITVSSGAALGITATNTTPWQGTSVTYADATTLPLDMGSRTMIPGQNPAMSASNLIFSGTTTLSITGGLWVITGSYPLISYTGSLSGTIPTLGTLPAGIAATLVNNSANKTIDLQITAVPFSVPSSTTAWTNLANGSASGTWGVTANWNNGIASGIDVQADFSTLNIATNSRIIAEAPRTIGKLYMNDVFPTSGVYWEMDGGTNAHLTLATSTAQPEICVTNTQLMLGGIEGVNGFVKTGNGTLVIYGDGYSNKLSGPIVVKNGYLGTAGLLPFKGIGGDIFVLDGAAFEANQSFDIGSFSNNFYLSGRGGTAYYFCNGNTPDGVRYDGEPTPFGALDLHGNVFIDGTVTLLGDTRITHGYNSAAFNKAVRAEGTGRNLEVAITVGGQGALDFSKQSAVNLGAGVLTVNGMVAGSAAIKYYSDTNAIICNGGLIVTNYGSLIAAYSDTRTLTLSGGLTLAGTNAVFDLLRSSLTLPYLTGNGRLTLSQADVGTSVVTLNQTGNYTFSGTADESALNGGNNASATRPLSFVKNGSGTWTLSGTNTTYHGSTIVNGGEVRITGKVLNSDVIVMNGARFSGHGGEVKSLSFASNSVFTVTVNGAATEQTTVVNTVTIAPGAKLTTQGDYTRSTNVAILKTTGGVSGSFSTEGLPPDVQIVYTANEVRLIILKGTVMTLR